ncbi:MAG: hypothetical protein V4643_11105 [Bacteroidota bacterium]
MKYNIPFVSVVRAILTFDVSFEDTIMQKKEYFTADSLCRTIKYVSYVWETDRYNTGQWVKETMYTQRFDANDSLIEKINFEGQCINDDNELMEDRKYVWYRTKKEEWAYGNKPTKYTEYSVKEWNRKNKKWKLVQKDRTSWNEQGKVLYRITREKKKEIHYGWHFSKREYTYDSTGKNVIVSTSCGVTYILPFCEKITGFKDINTYEAEGKTSALKWWCMSRDSFIYNSLGKLAMELSYYANGVPSSKDSIVYQNNGLTAYDYLTRFNIEKQQREYDSSLLTITTTDSLGYKLFIEQQYLDTVFYQQIMRRDAQHNIIYEESKTKQDNIWKIDHKYSRYYTYDVKGRILTDEYYAWPGENGADSTLSSTREYKYDNNGNTILASEPHGESFEAIYDDKGYILYKLSRGTILSKYYYTKQ